MSLGSMSSEEKDRQIFSQIHADIEQHLQESINELEDLKFNLVLSFPPAIADMKLKDALNLTKLAEQIKKSNLSKANGQQVEQSVSSFVAALATSMNHGICNSQGANTANLNNTGPSMNVNISTSVVRNLSNFYHEDTRRPPINVGNGSSLVGNIPSPTKLPSQENTVTRIDRVFNSESKRDSQQETTPVKVSAARPPQMPGYNKPRNTTSPRAGTTAYGSNAAINPSRSSTSSISAPSTGNTNMQNSNHQPNKSNISNPTWTPAPSASRQPNVVGMQQQQPRNSVPDVDMEPARGSMHSLSSGAKPFWSAPGKKSTSSPTKASSPAKPSPRKDTNPFSAANIAAIGNPFGNNKPSNANEQALDSAAEPQPNEPRRGEGANARRSAEVSGRNETTGSRGEGIPGRSEALNSWGETVHPPSRPPVSRVPSFKRQPDDVLMHSSKKRRESMDNIPEDEPVVIRQPAPMAPPRTKTNMRKMQPRAGAQMANSQALIRDTMAQLKIQGRQ